jgi:hypothetical protein
VLSVTGRVRDSRDREFPIHIEVPFFPESRHTSGFRVLSVHPARGLHTGCEMPIVITFSRPAETSEFPAAFRLSPDRPYRTDWNPDRTRVEIFPADTWRRFGTTSFRVSEEFRDEAGNRLERAYDGSFYCDEDPESPQIEQLGWVLKDDVLRITPDTVLPDIPSVDKAVVIRFSHPMDRSATETAFSVYPHVPGRRLWPDPGILVYVPDTGFDASLTYRVRVGTSARSAFGVHLQSPLDAGVSFADDILTVEWIDGVPYSPAYPIQSPFDHLEPIRFETGEFPHSHTFRIRFNKPFEDPDTRHRVIHQIRLQGVFPESLPSPRPVMLAWSDNRTAVITFEGFSSSPGQRFYSLVIPGGPFGVSTERGETMEEDLRVLFLEESM